jgi:GNAT superfamily N-acetyltransferase
VAGGPDREITPPSRTHDRGTFARGEPLLDEFLARYARQDQDQGISRTCVATGPGERRRLPKYPVPVVHPGRLAVERSARGQGLGERLPVEALRLALQASEAVGACAVEVVARNGGARDFHAKCGFVPPEDDRLHLHLPVRTVRRALAVRGGGAAPPSSR